jgi:hypothetical protein
MSLEKTSGYPLVNGHSDHLSEGKYSWLLIIKHLGLFNSFEEEGGKGFKRVLVHVKHKQIFLCQLTFRLMQKKILTVEYTDKEMNFLLNCPIRMDTPNTLKEWLPDLAWFGI